jgi:hypothetical protein
VPPTRSLWAQSSKDGNDERRGDHLVGEAVLRIDSTSLLKPVRSVVVALEVLRLTTAVPDGTG